MMKRYPQEKIGEAVMRAVACAGWNIIAADGEVADREKAALLARLRNFFTDEPERELLADAEAHAQRLKKAISMLNTHGGVDDRRFVILQLAHLIFADKHLHPKENPVLLDIAGQLGFAPRETYAIFAEVEREHPGWN
jgi:uncharacterized tellurite resistance protein B-like protein